MKRVYKLRKIEKSKEDAVVENPTLVVEAENTNSMGSFFRFDSRRGLVQGQIVVQKRS